MVAYLILSIAIAAGIGLPAYSAVKKSRLKVKEENKSPKANETDQKTPSAPAAASRSYAWMWWPVIILVFAVLGWWGYKHLQSQPAHAPKVQAPIMGKVFTPLILEATAYNKAASQGVEDNKETTPPEALVKGGGKIIYSFFVGTELPKDKSVLVKATLIPDAANPQTHLGDPVFSIGDSPNQKIHLRSGPQEIILGCPAREIKRGENFFSYQSGGMYFKISGPVRVYLSP